LLPVAVWQLGNEPRLGCDHTARTGQRRGDPHQATHRVGDDLDVQPVADQSAELIGTLARKRS
jgi:hypothetical protein